MPGAKWQEVPSKCSCPWDDGGGGDRQPIHESSFHDSGDASTTVIDGSTLLWNVYWPMDGCVADFIVNVKKRIASYLTCNDVYLIFDRYHEYSIVNNTRWKSDRSY